MEFKKEYFPIANAPDIVKRTVMQHVYGNKKNLNKRFYFYRVYAPAFLLLFIVWGGMTYYQKANKLDLEIYTLNNNSGISSEFGEDIGVGQKTTAMPQDTITNGNEALNNSITTNDTTNNNLVNNDTTVDNSVGNIAMKSSKLLTDQVSSINTVAVDNSQKTLNQQINEIEILMNDISSITSQEEILF
ncbi:MAG: hypothetical protein WAZ12_05380 [Candidatus Absconditicoccaceae bacterium]